jgi:hypothetical protein
MWAVAEPRTMPLHREPDDVLAGELRALGSGLDVPAADDLPARVRERIAGLPAPAREPWWRTLLPTRPARRALVLALALVIALAAIAGAINLGLPGLQIILGPGSTATLAPTPTPPPSGDPPGSAMGLGRAVTEDEAAVALQRPLPVIDDPAYGPPDAIYVQGDRDRIVTQVWGPGAGRPLANSHGVSMILTAIPARLDVDLVKKLVDGGVDVEFLRVVGVDGFWIEGAHEVFVNAPGPDEVADLRVAGDVLLWSKGGLTYRLESALGRNASMTLAERVRAP